MITIKNTTSNHMRASIRTTNSINSHMEVVATTMKRALICLFVRTQHKLTLRRGYYNADANNPYQQEGGYYDGQQQAYQDEYYNDQYYDQGTPAAGQQAQYGQAGYRCVSSALAVSSITC